MLDHYESDLVYSFVEHTDYPDGQFDIRLSAPTATPAIDRMYLTVNLFNGGVATPALGGEALTARDASLRDEVYMWQEMARFRVNRYFLEYIESETEFVPSWDGEHHVPRPIPSNLVIEIADCKVDALLQISEWNEVETPTPFAKDNGEDYRYIVVKHHSTGETCERNENQEQCNG